MPAKATNQYHSLRQTKSSGFTLIELVIGMTILGIAMGIILSAMLPKEKQSADLIHMIRAAELGQSLMNEIIAKPFDENTMPGSLTRCNEVTDSPCTPSISLGPEGDEVRNQYNDVDDYHGLKLNGADLESLYRTFKVEVTVFYDNDYDGVADSSFAIGDNLAKLISITVYTPLGTPINFTSYRANYE